MIRFNFIFAFYLILKLTFSKYTELQNNLLGINRNLFYIFHTRFTEIHSLNAK